MMEQILHTLTQLDYFLLGALVVLFIWQVYFYARYMAAVSRQQRRLDKHPLAEPQAWPGVSVIVSARNEEQNLRNFLYALLNQDYPQYELIVVNDGSEDRTQMVLEDYHQRYSNLHITFVPVDARVTSSKKLALTLAIKAAKYEHLLLTDADCVPESNHWIREMVKGMLSQPNAQLALGYSPYFLGKECVNRIIRYETLFNGLHYMGRAICGQPYMGVGRNMMYTKSMFMERKGFSGQLTLRSGDDDLFVNKVANRTNTVVVCHSDALTWSLPKQTFREWMIQKRRHLSVSPYYKQSTRMMLGLESVMRGLWYVAVIAGLALGTFWVMVLTAFLLVVRLLMQMGIINGAARRMGEKPFGLIILWYDICLPLLTAFLLSTQPRNQINRW